MQATRQMKPVQQKRSSPADKADSAGRPMGGQERNATLNGETGARALVPEIGAHPQDTSADPRPRRHSFSNKQARRGRHLTIII